MGAWGHGLFQSDNDFDIVSELSSEAGLDELEEETRASKPKADEKNEHDGTKDKDAYAKDYIYYSLYGNICSDIGLVRKHLNDTGVLVSMLEKYEAKLLSGDPGEFFRESGYMFMLLGACAISLGCTIPASIKNTMQKAYMCVGLPSEGVQQMNKALNGPIGYKDGEPYDFESLDLVDTANSMSSEPVNSSKPWVGLNVWGPGSLFYNPPKGDNSGLKELQAKFRAKANEDKHGPDVCGGCGAEDGKKGHLLTCAKCKSRKYCSKACQNSQWKAHKDVCAEPVVDDGA